MPLDYLLERSGQTAIGSEIRWPARCDKDFQAAASYYTERFKMQALFDLMGVRYVDTEMKMTPF